MFSWRGDTQSSSGMTIPPTRVHQQPPQSTSMTDVLTLSLIIFSPQCPPYTYRDWFKNHQELSSVIWEKTFFFIKQHIEYKPPSEMWGNDNNVVRDEFTVRFWRVNLLLPLWAWMPTRRQKKGIQSHPHNPITAESENKWQSGSHPFVPHNCDSQSYLQARKCRAERSAFRRKPM